MDEFEQPETDKWVLKTVLEKFEEHFTPRKNVTLERFYFNNCSQNLDETIDQNVTRLKALSRNCEFAALEDFLIKDRIVCGINDN